MQKNIVVIGPESTGKTELCKKLALYYNTIWLPEYARSYIETINRKYNIDDILHIAKKQIELENDLSLKNELLFIDTDLIITKVWLLHVYKTCPEWINEAILKVKRTLYLLCFPDLPWEFDIVRENPTNRDFFFNWYLNEIEKTKVPYVIIKGIGNDRLNNSIEAVNKFL